MVWQAMLWSAANGFGLALVIPCVQSLVADYNPADVRGQAFGLLGLTAGLGMVPTFCYSFSRFSGCTCQGGFGTKMCQSEFGCKLLTHHELQDRWHMGLTEGRRHQTVGFTRIRLPQRVHVVCSASLITVSVGPVGQFKL